MTKHTKLFKIGEYAYYGKWRLTVYADGSIIIEGLDYNTNVLEDTKMYKKFDYHEIFDFLEDVSTYYWAEQMIEWIQEQLKNLPNKISQSWE